MRSVVVRLLSSIALAASLCTAARASLPFIENDYARALGEARRRDVPLFVEAWAPW